MRIAIVCPYDLGAPGGVQHHVRALAHQLRQRGDAVVVLAPLAGHQPGRVVSDEAFPVVTVGRPVPVAANGSVAPIAVAPGAVRAVGRALRALRPDVVHVHEPMMPAVGVAAVLASHAPVVATFHAYAERHRLYRASRGFTRRVFRRIADPLAVSTAAATFHAGALDVDASSFTIVPNGVDVARFRRPDVSNDRPELDVAGRRDDRSRLLFVGRLERRKGVDVALNAFVQVRRAGHDVEMVVVGDGPQRRRAEQVIPSDLVRDVTWSGRVDGEALVASYRTADIAVIPARGGESFGMVLLEAMAASAAVIASDLPGFREVTDDGRAAVLVPADDPAALAAAIVELHTDTRRRTDLISRGLERAVAHDWPTIAERVRSRYDRVVRTQP